MKPAVAYIRTSTSRQTLGLDAQQAALDRFAQAEGFNILATFSEQETGKGADALARRPKLKEALKTAAKHKAPIIVAKLVGRTDYSQLVALYTGIMTQDNKGFYLKRFQALVTLLESVEAGSGLAR